MGIISSKYFKSESKPTTVSTAIQTDTPKLTTQIPDVRSPTAEIVRTPIIVEKLSLDLDSSRERRSLPLRNKLLKTLKLDPRSPTVGIYRTPILIEGTSPDTTPNEFDSPVSIYSTNVKGSPIEDIMTPIEPSVNVSGFEIPKEIFCGEDDVTVGYEETQENQSDKPPIKVSDQPNTAEAKKLLEEIISEEETFIKKIKKPIKKDKMGLRNSAKNVAESKGKSRTPLSNITASTNSPITTASGIKLYSKNKVVPEFGLENSVSPNVKQMIQWDQNKTVFI